jgi:hypothetical protein
MYFHLSTLLLPLAFLQSWALAQTTFSCSSAEPVGVCCLVFVASFPASSLTTGLDCAEATETSDGVWECGAYLNGEVPEPSCCASVSQPIECIYGYVRLRLMRLSSLSMRKILSPRSRTAVPIPRILRFGARFAMEGNVYSGDKIELLLR